ncbi:DUF4132 domain-containing protein [Actinoplanes sp. NPDC051851]|uniref:DUF4132 domain-containing protein n=1 Tax=Actinoplanes sp. NPDC051851 TaxID=3154753 RepID=UPI00343A3316
MTIEDTWEIPSAWRRFVLPRRSSLTALSPTSARTSAAAIVSDEMAVALGRADEVVAEHRDEILGSFGHPGTRGEVAEAGRRLLDGAGPADPLGAAAVLMALVCRLGHGEREDLLVFPAAWRARYGLPFAAAALAEFAELRPGPFARHRPIITSVPDRDLQGYGSETATAMVKELRRVIVAAPPEEYAEVVAALAAVRGRSFVQRVLISVLVPDEQAWSAEISAELISRPARESLKALLLTAVTEKKYALPLARALSPYYVLFTPEILYTFAASRSPAVVPALTDWADRDHADAEDRKRLFGLLAGVGGDEAIAALLARLDQPQALPAALDAVARSPRAAVRRLAATDHPAAVRMLRAQVARHPELAVALRDDLAGPARSRLDEHLAALHARTAGAAPADRLPPVLVTPPWTKRTRRTPLVVRLPLAAEAPRVVWEEGEREDFAAFYEPGAWSVVPRPFDEFAREMAAGTLGEEEAVWFLLKGPQESARPAVAAWRPAEECAIGYWGWPLLARFGPDAVPVLADRVARRPDIAELLVPVASAEVALVMAGWHAEGKRGRRAAGMWFDRHPGFAARALIPVAVGAAGSSRTAAEAGLRVLDPALVRSAATVHGPEVLAAIEEILAVDPLDMLPRSMPKLPDWADPALLPAIRLVPGPPQGSPGTDAGGTLPASAVRHLISMLAISRLDRPYAGLELVAEACDRGDLAEFAWGLFDEWRRAGHPARQGWAFAALGLLGDDGTVRRLAPVIRAWPGEGGHARAVTGLDVLAAIGTDVALMYLHGIAQKVKFRALRESAEEKIADLAEELGLTADELADRLVPDLGLGAGGSLVLDYGRRSFTVGFDEQLKPYVTDAAGKRLQALPRPGAQDDPVTAPAAWQRFAGLKKDVRAIAADQIGRLERAMVDQRRWSAGDFRTWFAGHPLLRHLAARLVWLRLDAAGTPIGGVRLAEDGTLADVRDETVTPGADERIGVAYPLELGEELAGWSEVFADYAILQPFPQLGRDVRARTPEQVRADLGDGFVGAKVLTGRLLGLERRGWRRGVPQDAGIQGWLERDLPGDRTLILEILPGIVVGAPAEWPDQEITRIWLEPPGGRHHHRPEEAPPLGTLDGITAAELIRELTEVTA